MTEIRPVVGTHLGFGQEVTGEQVSRLEGGRIRMGQSFYVLKVTDLYTYKMWVLL